LPEHKRLNTMNKTYFRYKEHPGDLFRDANLHALPEVDGQLEHFLTSFLGNYQSDDRVAYLNDLSMLLNNEFEDESQELKFRKQIGFLSNPEIQLDIQSTESKLKAEAFERFYELVGSGEIEVVSNSEH
jgi:hypothetical protein